MNELEFALTAGAAFALGYFAKSIVAKAEAAYAKAHAAEQAIADHLKAAAADIDKKA